MRQHIRRAFTIEKLPPYPIYPRPVPNIFQKRRIPSLRYDRELAEMSSRLNRTIYVGNLPGNVRKREIEDLFHKYGPIVDVELKIPARPPGYAFVEFEDRRDAEDAVYGRDGYDFDGCRLRVELAHGGRHPSLDRYSSYNGSGSSRGSSRRSDYRVLVTGLPSSASWQDLKDHMRRAGDVCFSEVYPERHGVTGIVDYTNYDDMKYAIKKLDDSLFKNAFSRAYIRVREYESRRSYSKSPSRSPYSRNRCPGSGRSASESLSGRRTRSASPVKSRSPSHSRSRSRSKSPAPRPSRRDLSPSNKQEKSPSRSPVCSNYGRSSLLTLQEKDGLEDSPFCDKLAVKISLKREGLNIKM